MASCNILKVFGVNNDFWIINVEQKAKVGVKRLRIFDGHAFCARCPVLQFSDFFNCVLHFYSPVCRPMSHAECGRSTFMLPENNRLRPQYLLMCGKPKRDVT